MINNDYEGRDVQYNNCLLYSLINMAGLSAVALAAILFCPDLSDPAVRQNALQVSNVSDLNDTVFAAKLSRARYQQD